MMFQGLPLLTADEHELHERVDQTDPPDDRPGWTLIGYVGGSSGSEMDFTASTTLLWARRKDGIPLVCSHPDAESLQRVITTLSAGLQAAEQESNELRKQVAALEAELEDVDDPGA